MHFLPYLTMWCSTYSTKALLDRQTSYSVLIIAISHPCLKHY